MIYHTYLSNTCDITTSSQCWWKILGLIPLLFYLVDALLVVDVIVERIRIHPLVLFPHSVESSEQLIHTSALPSAGVSTACAYLAVYFAWCG
jgi:hypothetical protein